MLSVYTGRYFGLTYIRCSDVPVSVESGRYNESCPDFCDIYAILIDGSIQEVDGYTLHDGYLFLGRKLWIPRISLIEFLVWELHDGLAGHFGNEKTIEAVEYRFYWPGLKHDVAKHVRRCHTCQLAKQQNRTPVCTLHYRSQIAHGRMLVWTLC